MQEEDPISPSGDIEGHILWNLTEKGNDTLPILMCMAMFGSKWLPEKVFHDQNPRNLNDIFEDEYIRESLRIP